MKSIVRRRRKPKPKPEPEPESVLIELVVVRTPMTAARTEARRLAMDAVMKKILRD
jgi:hypothetical protein